jgi:YidC/Oxa1 family membrane protein insertase
MNKRMIVVMLVMMGAFIGWQLFMSFIYDKQGWFQPGEKEQLERRRAATMAAATREAASRAATSRTTASAPATTTKGASEPASAPAIRPKEGDGKDAELGSVAQNDPKYSLGLSLSARGGAVKAVTLNSYHKTIERKELYTFQNQPNVSAADAPFAARRILIDDKPVDLSSVTWSGGVQDGKVVYSTTIEVNGEAEGLIIRKIWAVRERVEEGDKVGQGYEVELRYELENKSSSKPRVRLEFNGPQTSAPESNSDQLTVIGGHGTDGSVTVEAAMLPEVVDAKTKAIKHEKLGLLWAGVGNSYFNAIVLPVTKGAGNLMKVEEAQAVAVNADSAAGKHALITFKTAEVTLEKKTGTASLGLEVFLGPKLRRILGSQHFSQFPRAYDNTLMLGGSCFLCPTMCWSWLVGPLVWLLNLFQVIVHDWGIALIILVLLVRLALHPITKASQVSMGKMAKLGPEMEKLKKKFADQPEELRKAQAEFIRQQGIAPFLGCLPMFLQMPIWIALWQSLQSSFELRHASFLWGLTWIKDLSQPDHLDQALGFNFALPGFLCFPPFVGLNILPILMGVMFYLQQKLTPKPPTMSKEQETQQKMMQWMTVLLFPIMLYSGPSGLNLYIFASTLFGVWESKRVRKHIQEREEAEKAGKVLVDAPQTRAGKRLSKDEKEKDEPKRGLAGWLASLQEKAEQMRNEAEKKKRK